MIDTVQNSQATDAAVSPQGPSENGRNRKFWRGLNPAVLVPLIVACALFMEQVDSTVISTSLPMIAHDLGKDPIVLKLGLTAYLLSLAVFIPVSGWIADRFGGRTVFCAAIALFMVSSMLCGLSHSFAFFVAARFMQGAGGAMMVPVGRIVILRTVQRDELVTALSYLTMPAMLGPVIGPPLGGFITTYLNWRWIFFINVPMSILGIALALRFMDDFREPEVPKLDVIGFFLSAVGLLSVMFGLTTISDHLMPISFSVAFIVLGSAGVYGYLRYAPHKEQPLLDLKLFKRQTFYVGIGGGSLFRIGVGSISLMLPLLFQLGFGLSPLQSGMLTCATAVGSFFMKPLAKPVLHALSFRSVLIYNALFSGAGIAAFGLLRVRTGHSLVFAVLLIVGLLYSLQFTALNAIAYAEIEDTEVSQATSIFAMIQQLSLGSGVAVGAFALQAAGFFHGHQMILASDFPPAFYILGFISATSAISAIALPANAGASMAGREAGSDECMQH